MTRKLLALALLCLALPAQAADGGWLSLWRNADQRGEALLQAGDAAAAAKVYADLRRKAHAELLAGDYARAARDLAAFDDADAHYNRGNALAHAGDLQGALAAYDAALKLDPNDRDARHNRDLVADALKRQQPPKDQSGDASKDGKRDVKDKASSSGSEGSQGKQGDQDQQGKQGQQATQARPGGHGKQDNASPPGANAKAEEAGRSAANQANRTGQANKQPAGDQAAAAKNAPGAGSTQQDGRQTHGAEPAAATPAQDGAEQARRDAAASLGGMANKPQNDVGQDEGNRVGGAAAAAPFNEQKLAQEQWLRSIPDDPGGLLRRKFLIEHLMRQRKAQP